MKMETKSWRLDKAKAKRLASVLVAFMMLLPLSMNFRDILTHPGLFSTEWISTNIVAGVCGIIVYVGWYRALKDHSKG